MKKTFSFILGALVALCLSHMAFAAEHGGEATATHEHGGKEHGGAAEVKTPSADDIRNTMKSYVETESQKTNGNFEVSDPETSTTRKLSLVRVHERVGKTGDYYYSCADFKDVDSGEMLDLDLDVEDNAGTLKVADVRIHKVSGQERYTYDANDNRIPLNQ